jgi:hypothetical protein
MSQQATPSTAAAPSDEQVIADMRHWLEQAVIGLNLCPFAKAVYVKNQVRMVVSHARNLDGLLDDLDRELALLQSTPASEVDTTLLIHPTLLPDFETFNDLVGIAEEVVAEHELEGVVQVAAFHPQFVFDGEAPDDMSHCTNRAPYPTLHLLREDSLSQAIDAFGDTDAIYQNNMQRLRQLGLEGWKKLMQQKIT